LKEKKRIKSITFILMLMTRIPYNSFKIRLTLISHAFQHFLANKVSQDKPNPLFNLIFDSTLTHKFKNSNTNRRLPFKKQLRIDSFLDWEDHHWVSDLVHTKLCSSTQTGQTTALMIWKFSSHFCLLTSVHVAVKTKTFPDNYNHNWI